MSAASGARRASATRADDGDKAVWISFADLMTALMVLFLMVMVVTLLAITRALPNPTSGALTEATPASAAMKGGIASDSRTGMTSLANAASAAASPSAAASATAAADAASAASLDLPDAEDDPQSIATKALLQQLAQAVEAAPGVRLDARRHVIEFGDRARFATGSHRLDADSVRRLREFAPSLLAITQSELGRRWVRRVVVEGFADPRGSYLYNLHLSLQRGERVLCTLLAGGEADRSLDAGQRAAIRSIFAVGGFSFNDPRATLDESRRIELRIEFGPPPASAASAPSIDVGSCALDA